MIGQKHQRPEFGVAGTYQATPLADGKLLQIVRELNGSRSVLLLNLSDEAQAIPEDILKDRKLQPGWIETEASDQLPAWQVRTWQN